MGECLWESMPLLCREQTTCLLPKRELLMPLWPCGILIFRWIHLASTGQESISILHSFWGLSMGSRILSFDIEVQLFPWLPAGEGSPHLDTDFPRESGPKRRNWERGLWIWVDRNSDSCKWNNFHFPFVSCQTPSVLSKLGKLFFKKLRGRMMWN